MTEKEKQLIVEGIIDYIKSIGMFDEVKAFFTSLPAEDYPMPEDTVIFQKGVAEGRRLMMEDAMEVGETQLFWEKDGDRAFPTFDPPVEDLLDPGIISLKFEEEDKVKVIIIPIKED